LTSALLTRCAYHDLHVEEYRMFVAIVVLGGRMTALQPDTLVFGMQFVAGTPKNAGCLHTAMLALPP
jgi:hypothetical protein